MSYLSLSVAQDDDHSTCLCELHQSRFSDHSNKICILHFSFHTLDLKLKRPVTFSGKTIQDPSQV